MTTGNHRQPDPTATPDTLATGTGVAYLALWALTAASAAATAAGGPAGALARPHDALTETPGTALQLLAHNAPVVLWPLALTALGWPAIPLARRIGDALIVGQIAAHALVVGQALGQQPLIWPYLPHLPLEWLTIALPAGAWIAARRHGAAGLTRLASVAAATLLALALAAVTETYLVPVA